MSLFAKLKRLYARLPDPADMSEEEIKAERELIRARIDKMATHEDNLQAQLFYKFLDSIKAPGEREYTVARPNNRVH